MLQSCAKRNVKLSRGLWKLLLHLYGALGVRKHVPLYHVLLRRTVSAGFRCHITLLHLPDRQQKLTGSTCHIIALIAGFIS